MPVRESLDAAIARIQPGMRVLVPPACGLPQALFEELGRHSEGAPVTTPRSLVNVVVTEHGVADLRGLNLQERRRALIDLAAPEFRAALEP